MRLAIVLGAIVSSGSAAAQPTPNWEIKVPEHLEVGLHGTASVPITFAVDRGFSISKDGPVLIDVVPEGGLTIKKRRLGRVDAVDPEADVPRFVIPVRGDAVGDHVVKLRIRVWLCGGKVCRPLDLKRQTSVSVAAPVESPTP